jgi:ATP-dependent RNA circularization protein (DNA/RNA ligase family)|tara:strand:- start:91 stop:351 length:261 start_codon:yes stop_codon:yes gene_type:complete
MPVDEIIKAVQDQGITVVMAVGMGYFIFFIWKFVTQKILPSIEKATMTTVHLIDRVRMLDNDMIRMDQKINTILELRDIEKEKKDD